MTSTDRPTEDSDPTISEFRRRYLADVRAGTPRELSEYISAWPEHEVDIARLYLSLEDSQSASAAIGDDQRLGPYVVMEELGRGGQGVVYRARDTRLGRIVALKVLSRVGPDQGARVRRFRREAEVASRLQHPGICAVHEADIVDGIPYIAMAYIEGETLSQRLKRLRGHPTPLETTTLIDRDQDPSPSAREGTASFVAARDMSPEELRETLRVFEKVARALHFAHQARIIHRDIKPANIMVDDDGEPSILDFGVARQEAEDLPTITVAGDVFGTPAYMSPEQIAGEPLDARADVYSLGVTLYEILTLSRPFRASSRDGLYRAIMAGEAEPLRARDPSFSRDLELVVMTAMASVGDQRYQTAQDLAEDLTALVESRPISARPLSLLERGVKWARRRPVAAAVAAILSIGAPVVTALGGYIIASLPDIQAQRQAEVDSRMERALERGFFDAFYGQPERALAHFQTALEADPGAAEAMAGLALTHLSLDAPLTGLQVIHDAESVLDDPNDLHAVKTELLIALGRNEEAQTTTPVASSPDTALRWFIEGTHQLQVRKRLGRHTLDGRRALDRAIGSLRRAIGTSRHARRAYYFQLAMALGLRPGGEQAGVIADAIASLWPDSAQAWLSVGIALRYEAPPAAVAAYQRAIDLDPTLPHVHMNLGIQYSDMGQWDHAEAALRESLERGAANPTAHHALGVALDKKGDRDGAAAEYKTALALDPTHAESLYNLGLGHSMAGRHIKARAMYEAATEAAPRFVKPYVNLGITLCRMGEPQSGIAHLQTATRLDPECPEAHYNLGLAFKHTGDLQGAAAAFKESIRHKRDATRAHLELGVTLRMSGDSAAAIRALKEASRLAPDMAAARVQSGHCMLDTGDVHGAVDAYESALLADPDHVGARYSLGVALSKSSRMDDAKRAYAEVIRRAPDHAEAHCNLGLLIAAEGPSPEAVGLLRQGHDLGTRRGPRWTYPSARWLEDAVLRWVKELQRTDARAEATKVLTEYTEAYPDSQRLSAALRQLRGGG